jgi:putative ABC transport system permease protein
VAFEYKTIEELLMDEGFVSWCRGTHPGESARWNNWIAADPVHKQLAEEARRLLQLIDAAETPVPESQATTAQARLMQRLQALEPKASPMSIPPPRWRKKLYQPLIAANYLKIAVRNLRRKKAFSAINVFGLSIGLASCLLIALFVIDELSYDRCHEKGDRIYRIHNNISFSGSLYQGTVSPALMGSTLVKDYPAIENTVRITDYGPMLVKKGDQTLFEPYGAYADHTLFDVFTLPFVAGDPKTALKEPNTMVISESMAHKYFNSTDVIGKSLLTSNTENFLITGVIKDLPPQSHFHFNFIRTLRGSPIAKDTTWLNNNYHTYVLAKPGVDEQTINRYLRQTVQQYMTPEFQRAFHSNLSDLERKGDYAAYTAMPLRKIHLYSHVTGELEPNGSIQYVYIFIIIAVFILLLACVNFMNLSTAQAAGRAKEVGIRKVLGSLRYNLITQFLTESMLLTTIAMTVAIAIVAWALPWFNSLAGKNIILRHAYMGWLLPAAVVTILVVGLLAGSYPAFYLSAFQPIKVLKGKLSLGFKSGWLRNGLVVFQFTTAIVLIIGTLVVYNQLSFIRNRNLGYNRDQVLVLHNTYPLWVHARPFVNEVKQLSGVQDATMTRSLPNSGQFSNWIFFKTATMDASTSMLMDVARVDDRYMSTFEIKMARGRNFSPDLLTDSSAMIINESAARMLGYKQDELLNKTLYLPADPDNMNKAVPFRIIGVVKDFNYNSLHKKVGPLAFILGEERGAMAFRVNTGNVATLITQMQKLYFAKEKMPGQPFLYSFMDEEFNKLYQADQRTGKVFVSFAVFAIIIACLGLFGLVTYAAEQRTKEIGIRKVLGASAVNIVNMLSKDFLKLVMIATCIAIPIAWWSAYQWLQNYAYRTNINWWVFALAALVAVLVTIITISYQSIKAAISNPVKALKSE